jgi:hypothetical protein
MLKLALLALMLQARGVEQAQADNQKAEKGAVQVDVAVLRSGSEVGAREPRARMHKKVKAQNEGTDTQERATWEGAWGSCRQPWCYQSLEPISKTE